jgi:hypothetical protein
LLFEFLRLFLYSSIFLLLSPLPVLLISNSSDQILVLEAMRINAHEAIVIYRETDGKISRQIIKGPASHIPTANEWLHQFVWHGVFFFSSRTPLCLPYLVRLLLLPTKTGSTKISDWPFSLLLTLLLPSPPPTPLLIQETLLVAAPPSSSTAFILLY